MECFAVSVQNSCQLPATNIGTYLTNVRAVTA